MDPRGPRPFTFPLLFSSLLFPVPELNKLKKLSHEIRNPGKLGPRGVRSRAEWGPAEGQRMRASWGGRARGPGSQQPVEEERVASRAGRGYKGGQGRRFRPLIIVIIGFSVLWTLTI